MLKYDNKESFLKYVIEAINNDKLIVFVGSGVSKLCGLPLWKELAESLLQDCVNDKKCKFNYKNKHEILRSISDERELISIAENILKNAYNTRDVFIKDFNEKLERFDDKKALGIQKLLFGISKTIITTNADKSLDQDLAGQSIIYDVNKFEDYKDTSINKIIHIHGSVNDGDSLVFTTADYLRRYSEKNFRGAMQELFSGIYGFVILFVGYGFREMQLLDFLVTSESVSRENKAFFLNGYFSKDEVVFNVESEYYKEYGITLVAYERDKEDFEALIRALRKIKKEANKVLASEFGSFESISNLLNKEPSDHSLFEFSKQYCGLPLKFKAFLLENLSKSKYSRQWTTRIISDSTLRNEIFSLKNLVEAKKSAGGKEIIGVPFPGLELLTRVDVYSDETKSFYNDFINHVINAYLDPKKSGLFTNISASNEFLELIFSRKEFLANRKIVSFLEQFIEKSVNCDEWMRHASYKNEILKSLDSSRWLEFVKIIRLTILKNHDISYSIHRFFDVYSKVFCEACPLEIIQLLVDDLKKLIDSSYLKYTYDTFEQILGSSRDFDTKETFLRRWLAETISFLDQENDIRMFEYLTSEYDVFSKLVAIYVANANFDHLQRMFFDNIKKFSERIYFSEIYSLLSKNLNGIEENSLEEIEDFIDEIKYDDDVTSLFCKYALTKLLLERFPDHNEIKTMFESFDRSIKTQNLESNFADFKPLDGSKLIRVESKPYASPFADHLLTFSRDEFINWLKSVNKSEWKRYLSGFSYSFEKIDDKFNLLSDKTIELLKGAPDFVLDFLERRLTLKQDEFNVKLPLFLNIEKQKVKPFSKRGFISNLYDLVSTSHTVDRNSIVPLFESVWNCPLIEGGNSSEPSPSSIQAIYSSPTFHKYSLLLLMCPEEKIDALKTDLESRLDNRDTFAKAAMVSEIQYLWSYDSKWTSDHLGEMFGCSSDDENFAFYMFAFSSLHASEFVEALCKAGILPNLLKSKEFSSFAWQYSYLLLCNFVYQGTNWSAVEIISKTDHWQNSLSLLIDYASRTNRESFDKERFDQVLCTFKKENARSDFSYISAIKVLNFLNSDEVTERDEEYVLFALSGRNNASACEKLKNAILAKKFKPAFSDKVIEKFFKNIIDVYRYEKEVVELFQLIRSKKVKESVCNLLRKINPNLFEKLKEESN